MLQQLMKAHINEKQSRQINKAATIKRKKKDDSSKNATKQCSMQTMRFWTLYQTWWWRWGCSATTTTNVHIPFIRCFYTNILFQSSFNNTNINVSFNGCSNINNCSITAINNIDISVYFTTCSNNNNINVSITACGNININTSTTASNNIHLTAINNNNFILPPSTFPQGHEYVDDPRIQAALKMEEMKHEINGIKKHIDELERLRTDTNHEIDQGFQAFRKKRLVQFGGWSTKNHLLEGSLSLVL